MKFVGDIVAQILPKGFKIVVYESETFGVGVSTDRDGYDINENLNFTTKVLSLKQTLASEYAIKIAKSNGFSVTAEIARVDCLSDHEYVFHGVLVKVVPLPGSDTLEQSFFLKEA